MSDGEPEISSFPVLISEMSLHNDKFSFELLHTQPLSC